MVARTEQAIIKSFNHLISRYDFDKITIDMIIRDANVSRSTFYRYFHDKYDVMNANFKLLLDYYIAPSHCHSYKEMFFHLFDAIQKDWSTLDRLFSSTGINSFSNYIATYSYETALAITRANRNGNGFTNMEAAQCEIFCHGICKVYEFCVSGKYQLTASEIADILFDMAPSSLKDYWWPEKE